MQKHRIMYLVILILGGLALAAPSRRDLITPNDHISAYNFAVEIEGVTAGYFQGMDGPKAEIEVIEVQDGHVLRKRPGRVKFGDITLKKGYILTDDLQEWWDTVRVGSDMPKDIFIHQLDDMQNPKRTWRVNGAWPRSWKINSLDGKGNDVITEEITFVIEDLETD